MTNLWIGDSTIKQRYAVAFDNCRLDNRRPDKVGAAQNEDLFRSARDNPATKGELLAEK